jgi:hypothetical protein
LIYAALDVELLIELRDRLATKLLETGKWQWAEQEFAALVASAGVGPEPRRDPWRRTSGIITSTPVADWRTSPSFGTPAMPSPSGWTKHPARSCLMPLSPSWPLTSTQIEPHYERFRPSLDARPGVPKRLG